MIKNIPVVLLLGLSALTVAGAHDGHGEQKVMSGTVKTVLPERIEIETFDQNTIQLKRIWIETDAKTKYVRAKTKVDVVDPRPSAGERVTAVVVGEHAKDGSIRFVTRQLELPRRK